MSSSQAKRNPVEELAEEFLDRYRAGERPSLSEYIVCHPDLAQEIRVVIGIGKGFIRTFGAAVA